MSINGIGAASSQGSSVNQSSTASVAQLVSFAQTLLQQISGAQSATANTGKASESSKAPDPAAIASLLRSNISSATNLLDILNSKVGGASAVNGLSSTGRNLSLFDPESAYNMMSFINRQEVVFEAQYSELKDMGSYVDQLQQSAAQLQDVSTATSGDELKSCLQQFVTQYNAWVSHFDGDMATGGALHNVQAAEVSRYELEQSIKNMFNGAADGFKGLASLGLTIDDSTHLAKFDGAQLDAALASNKEGAVHTVQQFAGNFAKSAQLLTSAGNFISNRLANLSGAIHYIDSNLSSWQQEFGSGDSYQASPAVAQAAAAYRHTQTA